MLSKEEKALLSKKILQYRDSSTNVIVIITQSTLKDAATGEVYQLEEAAKHYFNNWGIGLKEKNNGVLFFVVKNDRKIRIATGSGVEEMLTNEDCQQIIDDNIVPHFKNKEYYKGLNEAIDKAMQTLSPELYPATDTAVATSENIPSSANTQSYTYTSNEGESHSSVLPFLILIFIIAFIIVAIVTMFGNNRAEDRMYNADGAYTSTYFERRNGIRWFFSGLFFNSLFNNRNTQDNRDDTYRNSNSGSPGNNYDSSPSGGFSASDSFSSSSTESSGSFGGGSSDGGGASGSW